MRGSTRIQEEVRFAQTLPSNIHSSREASGKERVTFTEEGEKGGISILGRNPDKGSHFPF